MYRKRRLYLIGVVSGILVLIYALYYSANNIKVEILNDVFRFHHEKDFKGNRWNLYINSNKKLLCSFIPLDGMSQEEMKDKLREDIVILYNNRNIRVYCILDYAYRFGKSYPIVYTLNGNDFYLWNADESQLQADIQKRLENLYEHISFEELKTVSNLNVLGAYVDKETFKGDKFSYVVDDGTKICNVEDERYKIQYYAQNENGIYAKISECCEDYCVTFTYGEKFIEIQFQNDSSNYWCKVDYLLNAINVEEDTFYNKIAHHITEPKMYDINNYFYEYTVSLLKI